MDQRNPNQVPWDAVVPAELEYDRLLDELMPASRNSEMQHHESGNRGQCDRLVLAKTEESRMDIDKIRQRAQEIWEAEGKPEGQHERHWQQAEEELSAGGELPQTSSPAHHSATEIPKGREEKKSSARSSQAREPSDFASENK